jgi:type II secretion system protein H
MMIAPGNTQRRAEAHVRMMRQPTGPAFAAPAGFTLVEVVMVLALLALLAGLVVLNVGGQSDSRRLVEGASRMAAMLDLARADAANLGKRLQVMFDAQGQMVVTFESDPLGAPDQFVPYGATWATDGPGSAVRVVTSRLTGPSALAGNWRSDGRQSEQSDFQPITFYPDGTCDTALVLLASANANDIRRALLRLDGLTGRCEQQVLSGQELTDFYESIGLVPGMEGLP